MLLCELFDDQYQDGDLVNRLRQIVIDVLTPLAAQGVPFITVDSVIDRLRQVRSGIDIDRALVMEILDPDQVKMINKIEGDRIYFSVPQDDIRKTGVEQAQKDAERISDKAAQQAQKAVTS